MRNKTYDLVFCSIISVLSFIALYFSAILANFSLVAFAISILILCVTVDECGPRWGLISGIVVGLLGFIFMPNKMILLPYALYFGYYPVLKLYIERINKTWIELILKVGSFSLAMLAVYAIARLFIPANEIMDSPIYVMAGLLEVTFLLFDRAVTQNIALYRKYISKRIRKRK